MVRVDAQQNAIVALTNYCDELSCAVDREARSFRGGA